jgi:hypothetical protein
MGKSDWGMLECALYGLGVPSLRDSEYARLKQRTA